MEDKNIVQAEKLIKQIGAIQVTSENYIKPCLETLDYLVKWNDRTEHSEWLNDRINEVMDIIIKLLKAPIEDD